MKGIFQNPKRHAGGDYEMSLELSNRSRIVGYRGLERLSAFSVVSLFLVDEAARVSDDLYLAIRPMKAGARRYVAISV